MPVLSPENASSALKSRSDTVGSGGRKRPIVLLVRIMRRTEETPLLILRFGGGKLLIVTAWGEVPYTFCNNDSGSKISLVVFSIGEHRTRYFGDGLFNFANGFLFSKTFFVNNSGYAMVSLSLVIVATSNIVSFLRLSKSSSMESKLGVVDLSEEVSDGVRGRNKPHNLHIICSCLSWILGDIEGNFEQTESGLSRELIPPSVLLGLGTGGNIDINYIIIRV